MNDNERRGGPRKVRGRDAEERVLSRQRHLVEILRRGFILSALLPCSAARRRPRGWLSQYLAESLRSHFAETIGGQRFWLGLIVTFTLLTALPCATARGESLTVQVVSAQSGINLERRPSVAVKLSSDSGLLFEQFTSRRIGKFIEVRFNRRILMTTRITDSLVGGSLEIVGSFDAEEAISIARQLSTGGGELQIEDPR